MIQLVRVDYRLLHGQVVFAWVGALRAEHIVVANDKAALDSVSKMTLRLAKPSGVGLDIVTVDDAKKKLRGGKLDHKKVLVVIGNTKDAVRLAEALPELKVINYGGVSEKSGSKKFTGAIYLNDDEIADSLRLKEMGLRMEMRQLPSHAAEILNDKI